MDDDDSQAAWAQQEQDERRRREDEELERHRQLLADFRRDNAVFEQQMKEMKHVSHRER